MGKIIYGIFVIVIVGLYIITEVDISIIKKLKPTKQEPEKEEKDENQYLTEENVKKVNEILTILKKLDYNLSQTEFNIFVIEKFTETYPEKIYVNQIIQCSHVYKMILCCIRKLEKLKVNANMYSMFNGIPDKLFCKHMLDLMHIIEDDLLKELQVEVLQMFTDLYKYLESEECKLHSLTELDRVNSINQYKELIQENRNRMEECISLNYEYTNL